MKTIFLMCTTDPQKIPATILSRVQRFDFHRIPTDQIVQRLDDILVMELEESAIDCEWEMDALEYIAKIADGGMRDAITLLDKCLSYDSTELTMQTVITALGVMDYSELFSLFKDIYHAEDANIIFYFPLSCRKECINSRKSTISLTTPSFGLFVLNFPNLLRLPSLSHL